MKRKFLQELKIEGMTKEVIDQIMAENGRDIEREKAKNKEKNKKLIEKYSLKEAMKSLGVIDPDYLIFKHGGIEKFCFDEEGEPLMVEEILKVYRESFPYIFNQEYPNKISLVQGEKMELSFTWRCVE
ncbi:hypothetical protein [Sinanaerobacter sp. ZZT-01]|uniref:hypothetical protein n=1 Tax=Sinanaerobacter sp. ZZT-01 TaxID=3111540 RepID=UPI002D778805|nr:hypothetical protein [Sinanaerobacter sp. ZZT-01]WRR94095.1 hypothetical protein U5921_02955 [Sinanaerobacter sp. ZZT-01]